MKITNRASLPEGIVRAVAADPYDAGDSDITASSIGNPPLLETLKRRHWDELSEDASDRIWSLLGQAAHVIAERGAQGIDGVTAETRIFAEVSGWKLSGAFDHLNNGTLSDYKITSAWTIVYGDRIPEWEAQLNTLAWLIDEKEQFLGSPSLVQRLEVVAILRDWSERDLSRDTKGNYPKTPAVVIPLKLWEPKKRLAYIEERIKLHKKSREENLLIPCTDEERWAKTDRKTGVKTFVRCEKYCPVKSFCPVWEAEKNNEDLTSKLQLSLKVNA